MSAQTHHTHTTQRTYKLFNTAMQLVGWLLANNMDGHGQTDERQAVAFND